MKKIRQKQIDIVKKFVKSYCPYCTSNPTGINYACDGTPLTDKPGVQARKPCEYYRFRGTFKSGCEHPKLPERG